MYVVNQSMHSVDGRSPLYPPGLFSLQNILLKCSKSPSYYREAPLLRTYVRSLHGEIVTILDEMQEKFNVNVC